MFCNFSFLAICILLHNAMVQGTINYHSICFIGYYGQPQGEAYNICVKMYLNYKFLFPFNVTTSFILFGIILQANVTFDCTVGRYCLVLP